MGWVEGAREGGTEREKVVGKASWVKGARTRNRIVACFCHNPSQLRTLYTQSMTNMVRSSTGDERSQKGL